MFVWRNEDERTRPSGRATLPGEWGGQDGPDSQDCPWVFWKMWWPHMPPPAPARRLWVPHNTLDIIGRISAPQRITSLTVIPRQTKWGTPSRNSSPWVKSEKNQHQIGPIDFWPIQCCFWFLLEILGTQKFADISTNVKIPSFWPNRAPIATWHIWPDGIADAPLIKDNCSSVPAPPSPSTQGFYQPGP